MHKQITEQDPPRNLTLPNPVLRDLMQATVERGVPFRFRALGWSMSPFIRADDIVIVTPWQSRSPVVGQVVAFTHPESGLLLLHRIIQQRGSTYLIQGDNLPGQSDGWVPRENILGLVTDVNRNERSIWFGQGLAGVWIAQLSRLGLLASIMAVLRSLFR